MVYLKIMYNICTEQEQERVVSQFLIDELPRGSRIQLK